MADHNPFRAYEKALAEGNVNSSDLLSGINTPSFVYDETILHSLLNQVDSIRAKQDCRVLF